MGLLLAMTTWHELHTGVVHPWLCDQFGHLNVRNYSNFFNEAQFFAYLRAGFPQSVALTHGGHGVAAICRTNFMKELPVGSLIYIDGGMVASSNKTFTFFCRMHNAETGEIHATSESLEVFFDPTNRKSAVIPEPLRPFIQRQLDGPDKFEQQSDLPRSIGSVNKWLDTPQGKLWNGTQTLLQATNPQPNKPNASFASMTSWKDLTKAIMDVNPNQRTWNLGQNANT